MIEAGLWRWVAWGWQSGRPFWRGQPWEPTCRGEPMGGQVGVRLRQGTIVWALSSKAVVFNFFFSFSFLAALWHMGFPDQGSDLSCSCLWQRQIFNPLCHSGYQTCDPVLQRCCWSYFIIAGTPVFKILNVILESQGTVPSGRVHGVFGTSTWCLLIHMQSLLNPSVSCSTAWDHYQILRYYLTLQHTCMIKIKPKQNKALLLIVGILEYCWTGEWHDQR